MIEEWRPVVAFEGFYEVSDLGSVRSVDRVVFRSDGGSERRRGRVLKQTLNRKSGRLVVTLSRNGHDQPGRVAAMVAAAFLGPRPSGLMVLHNNGIANDNRLENLRYGTASANMIDKINHGRNYQVEKDRCPLGHELASPNVTKSAGARNWRTCDSCHKAWHAARRPGRTIPMSVLANRIYPIVMAGRWPSTAVDAKRLMAQLCAS